MSSSLIFRRWNRCLQSSIPGRRDSTFASRARMMDEDVSSYAYRPLDTLVISTIYAAVLCYRAMLLVWAIDNRPI